MKINKITTFFLILVIIINIGFGISITRATNQNLTLVMSLERYCYNYNGEFISTKEEYYLNHDKPLIQLLSKGNGGQITGKNYYCLNADVSYSWSDLDSSSTDFKDVTYLEANSKSLNETKKEQLSPYLTDNNYNQIMWLLDNIYILDTSKTREENLKAKRNLLEKAGLVYGEYEIDGLEGMEMVTCYKYIPVDEYNYSEHVSMNGQEGYFYYEGDEQKAVELTDEQIEAIQQAVIWYFTNYKENTKEELYNVRWGERTDRTWLEIKEQGDTDKKPLKDTENIDGYTIGAWKQEQASILYNYLIDAAENESKNLKTNPLYIEDMSRTIDTTTLEGQYIVGPIKINRTNTLDYKINKMIINGQENSSAYISDKQGERLEQDLNKIIGQEIYVTVPGNVLANGSVAIKFEGEYKSNKKTLWVEPGETPEKQEQPIIQVEPAIVPINLEVAVNLDTKFDLALRKSIVGITDAKGHTKFIRNEDKYDATREVKYKATDINTNNTATYNQRKDPVIVEKGDMIKYAITVYNEGQNEGYASEIVDQLPDGLVLKGYNANDEQTKSGEYKKSATENSKAIDYTYVYDPSTNKIIFNNNEPVNLSPYQGGEKLDSITIEIECEVVEEPNSTKNTYLTNIAYISKEHDSILNDDIDSQDQIGKDRDSVPGTNVNKNKDNLKTTGNEYNGYKGNENNNSVYDDTNNSSYYKGEQDDDDFEIVVVEPADFDLALQKYISAINGNTNEGRTAPTIDSSELAEGSKTTAKYTLDKTPIKLQYGDFVTYTFAVYNEGEIDGYVDKITDNIPTGLEFVYRKPEEDGKTLITVDSQGNYSEIEVNSDIYELVDNNSYWKIDQNADTTFATDIYNGEQTVSISCNLEDFLGEKTKLNAYDAGKDGETGYTGQGLSKVSVSVVLRVSQQEGKRATIRNEAAITEAEDINENKQNNDSGLKDRDSKVDEWLGKNENNNYQDDEDYDNIVIESIDLALTKFIAAVSEDETIDNEEYLTLNGGKVSKENPYTRATKVDSTELKAGTSTDAKYEKVKEPLKLKTGNYVLYTIRVYNEGETPAYAAEISDYLPEYLDFVDCEFNKIENEWSIDENNNRLIKTTKLSSKNGETNKLKAFDKENDDGEGSGLDYRDLQVLCKINENASEGEKLTNVAEISKYENSKKTEISKDEDSEPGNVSFPYGDEKQEDDDDYENVYVTPKSIDLALTKFIVAISEDEKIDNEEYLTLNGGEESKENPYTRAPSVNTTDLKNGTSTEAVYTKVNDPLEVEAKDYILYNIRIYNEGEKDGYPAEVTDYLPENIDFVDCNFNKIQNGWVVSEDGRTISTDILSYEKLQPNAIKAFNKEKDDGKGLGLDYKDLQVLCKINENVPKNQSIINIAEITKYENDKGEEINEDIDSIPNNKDEKQEDDDDEEKVLIRPIDLALTKFIAAISSDVNIENGEYLTVNGNVANESNPYTRATRVDSTELRDETSTDAKYEKVHNPLVVAAKSYVLYDIRVYNEGDLDCYAAQITDYLPEYLDFVHCEFNDNYGWKVESDGKTISTDILSYEKSKPNAIKAFDRNNDNGKGSGLDYRDLQVLCKVNDNTPTKANVINIAEISKYENSKGEEVPKDEDSEPRNVKIPYDKKQEDDDDCENIIVKTFDLKLLKYVSTVYVTEDDKTETIQTGNTGNETDTMPKVEINRKKTDSTTVKFGYTIKVINEGDIAGYAKEITDYVPAGLKFYEEDNQGWTDEGNNVISTRILENTLLQPGGSVEVTVILRWINGSDNLGAKTNIAEISEDYNDDGIPDKDSTPDNKVEGEDDINDAQILLSISTGLTENIIKYLTFGGIVLVVLATGIILIKKYVV